MGYASRYPGTFESGNTVTALRPPRLPRFPSFASLPIGEEASATRPLPPPAPQAPQRMVPTARPPRRDARLPAIFYGLSAGVLLGAVLCFTGVSFAPEASTEEASEPLLAAAGPRATPVAMRARMPGVRVEDLPRVLVRAEDLPLAPPLTARR